MTEHGDSDREWWTMTKQGTMVAQGEGRGTMTEQGDNGRARVLWQSTGQWQSTETVAARARGTVAGPI